MVCGQVGSRVGRDLVAGAPVAVEFEVAGHYGGAAAVLSVRWAWDTVGGTPGFGGGGAADETRLHGPLDPVSFGGRRVSAVNGTPHRWHSRRSDRIDRHSTIRRINQVGRRAGGSSGYAANRYLPGCRRRGSSDSRDKNKGAARVLDGAAGTIRVWQERTAQRLSHPHASTSPGLGDRCGGRSRTCNLRVMGPPRWTVAPRREEPHQCQRGTGGED